MEVKHKEESDFREKGEGFRGFRESSARNEERERSWTLYRPLVVDYNYENFILRASRMVRNPFQTILINYNSFVIDYHYETHNNRTDPELGARVFH